jgi:hypothetical protein
VCLITKYWKKYVMVVMLVIVIIYYVMGGQKLSTGYPQVWIKVLIKLSTWG